MAKCAGCNEEKKLCHEDDLCSDCHIGVKIMRISETREAPKKKRVLPEYPKLSTCEWI